MPKTATPACIVGTDCRYSHAVAMAPSSVFIFQLASPVISTASRRSTVGPLPLPPCSAGSLFAPSPTSGVSSAFELSTSTDSSSVSGVVVETAIGRWHHGAPLAGTAARRGRSRAELQSAVPHAPQRPAPAAAGRVARSDCSVSRAAREWAGVDTGRLGRPMVRRILKKGATRKRARKVWTAATVSGRPPWISPDHY